MPQASQVQKRPVNTRSHMPAVAVSAVHTIKKPELLVKSKKFNQMEMEMDKFLAKKQQISNSLPGLP